MNTLKFLFASSLIGLLAIASGLLQAAFDGRLEKAEHVQLVANKVEQLPQKFGNWVQLESLTLPETAVRILNCHGYSNRLYQNVETGQQVTVTLLYGPRGPISVHTPEVCLSSQGLRQLGIRTQLDVPGAATDNSFWRVGFGKQEGDAQLQVTYAWSDGGPWLASKHPRLWPASSLFKVQISSLPDSNGDEEFLKSFLEVWEQSYSPVAKT